MASISMSKDPPEISPPQGVSAQPKPKPSGRRESYGQALLRSGSILGCMASIWACSPTPGASGEDDDAGSGATGSDSGVSSGGNGGLGSGGGGIAGDGDGDGDGDGAGGVVGGTGGVIEPGEIPGGVALNGQPENYRFIRLTNEQWENSVRDIFQLADVPGASSTFFPDPPAGKFTNNEHALFVGEDLLGDFQRTAEDLAGTISSDSGVLAALGGVADPSAFIAKLGRRAYRRALSGDEQAQFETIWGQGAGFFASGDDNVDGARVFIETLLQAPGFLYRIELSEAGTRLSGLELASKLSLLLRNTTPSDELLATAESGELDTDAGLLAVAQGLLAETIATDVLTSFHREMYGIERYRNIEKDRDTFPQYADGLNEVLIESDLLFFRQIISEDGGVREIFTSNVAYVNDVTAVLYDVASPGPELSEVTLESDRPGILTRLGFLTYNATLVHPDPIHRGVDINNRLLCVELSPPPGEIPPLPPFEPGQTNRDRVEAHTGEGVCAYCHLEIINPLGYAFENFDAMGQFRTEDNGNAIDTASSYAFSDGTQSFSGAVELSGLLAESQQAHGCYSASLAEYFLTRDLSGLDEELVTAMQQASLGSDASIRELILQMIQNPLFTFAQGAAQ